MPQVQCLVAQTETCMLSSLHDIPAVPRLVARMCASQFFGGAFPRSLPRSAHAPSCARGHQYGDSQSKGLCNVCVFFIFSETRAHEFCAPHRHFWVPFPVPFSGLRIWVILSIGPVSGSTFWSFFGDLFFSFFPVSVSGFADFSVVELCLP